MSADDQVTPVAGQWGFQMDRRTTLRFLAAAGVLGIARPGLAQAPPKTARIGYLSAGDEAGTGHLYRSFVQGMMDQGYVEGKNVSYELRYAESSRQRIIELLKELDAAKLDVIMTTSQAGAEAGHLAGLKTPVVTVIASDPVAEGLVESLSHPGGNLTGVANMNSDLGAKRLQLLREAAPAITKVAVMFDKTATGNLAQMASLQRGATAMNLQVYALDVRHPEDIDHAFDLMRAENVDGLVVMENPVNYPHRDKVVKLAGELGRPAMYGYVEFAQGGGLMAYSASLPKLHQYAARYVDKILRGARPSDLPIEQPNLFELIINLRTAKTLGLLLPPSLLAIADEVIE